MEIIIPPLKKRKQDIRPLVSYFIEKHSKRKGVVKRIINVDGIEKTSEADFIV